LAAAQDASVAPSFGAAELRAGARGELTRLIPAGGSVNVGQTVPGCVGFIAYAPDFGVDFTPGPAGRPLTFSVASQTDTTLVIHAPDGRWVCDDDSGPVRGNPLVTFPDPAAGRYHVWVGAYMPGAPQASLLTVTGRASR
jgi:serine protease Do